MNEDWMGRQAALVRVCEEVEAPLIGCIAFGLIDRGTNVIQVRPTTLCPLSCIFCSTDAGPKSRSRIAEYLVSMDCLVEAFRALVEYKGPKRIEAHIDTVGEPATYPNLVELVQALSEVEGVEVVSMQTNAVLLTERMLERLCEAGLDRLNVSLQALDPDLASRMAGTPTYPLEKVLRLCEALASLETELLIAPVWLPGVNDGEIPRIIEYALRVGAGGRWPPLGIQKYEAHKRGRRPKGVRPMGWGRFYRELRALERRYGVKLVLRPEDFGTHRRPMVPVPFRVGERITVRIVAPGWRRGEALGVCGGRSVTLVGMRRFEVGARVRARVIRNKHNIILAEPV